MASPPIDQALVTPGTRGSFDYLHPLGYHTDAAEELANSVHLQPKMSVMELDCGSGNFARALMARIRKECLDIDFVAVAATEQEAQHARAKLVDAGLATPAEAASIIRCSPLLDGLRLMPLEIRSQHSPRGYDLIYHLCPEAKWRWANNPAAFAAELELAAIELHDRNSPFGPRTMVRLVPGLEAPTCGMTKVRLRACPAEDPEQPARWRVMKRKDMWTAGDIDFYHARTAVKPYFSAMVGLGPCAAVTWHCVPEPGAIPAGWLDQSSKLEKVIAEAHRGTSLPPRLDATHRGTRPVLSLDDFKMDATNRRVARYNLWRRKSERYPGPDDEPLVQISSDPREFVILDDYPISYNIVLTWKFDTHDESDDGEEQNESE